MSAGKKKGRSEERPFRWSRDLQGRRCPGVCVLERLLEGGEGRRYVVVMSGLWPEATAQVLCAGFLRLSVRPFVSGCFQYR
jgi:hypothetical protein